MQGFNKYYPPDYDGEKHKSLNSYRGKHALGDRARKIDQGILITRFELPFNIWCGTCDSHIGMGVRYNAEKKKIGMYYSTPMFSFRCKCHVCGGWFEIQTDPKNTRYVVTSGARQKDEEWNPEENGGFAIHDPEGKAGPSDPLAALEKTTVAQTQFDKVQAPRLEELQDLSEQYNADPYSLSIKLRRRFRTDKKFDQAIKVVDDDLKARYGLPETLSLQRDDQATRDDAKRQWEEARIQAESNERHKRRKLEVDVMSIPMASSSIAQPISRSSTQQRSKGKQSGTGHNALASLRVSVLQTTAKRTNPFAMPHRSKPPDGKSTRVIHNK